MADVQRRITASGQVRWDVRYRDEARRQRKRSFARKADAQRFASSVETDLLRGDWIDPKRGQELFEAWAERWLATIVDRKPKTRESYESIVAKHLVPRFGSMPVAAIDYPMVLGFVAELQRSGVAAKTVRNIRDVLRMIMRLAVRSGGIKSNPAVDIAVARTYRPEMVFLDPDQIMALANEVTAPPARYRRGERRVDGYPEYGSWFGSRRSPGCAPANWSRCGFVIWSYSTAGSRCRCRPPRPTANSSSSPPRPTSVARSRPSIVDRRPLQPRGRARARRLRLAVPPGRTVPVLELVQASLPPRSDSCARSEATRFHDLRHSYAAMLIAQGAHPRAIMERMGHSTITVTLDNYGHLFPKLDAALDDALDGMYRDAAPHRLQPVTDIGAEEVSE